MEDYKSYSQAIRMLRVSLVDQLENGIDFLLELLSSREVLNRDDREVVLGLPGPRAKVRKLLDIVECKGEEAARTFISIINQQQQKTHNLIPTEDSADQPQSKVCSKIMQKHKEVLSRRSESMLYYNTRHGEKIPFSEHYVNLLLVSGHQGLERKRHEVLTFGLKRLSMQQESTKHGQITPAKLFSSVAGSRPVKKVLVTGVAGIGKTMLVQKMLLDFGNNKDHLAFDFIIHLTFRDLNLITKPINLKELVLRKNRHLAKELDQILANDNKLLIILDGFDEFRHYRSCDIDAFVTEPDEDGEVAEVVASLMLGELLPNASVLLTSRPAAIGYIPVDCIDRFVLIAGFSMKEVQDFFQRYFQDHAFAKNMFEVVAANELMLTLCYIPAFCYIMCCILKESQDLAGESPKTMTDIYVQYLVALLRSHTQDRAKSSLNDQKEGASPQMSDVVLKLGQLAFLKLMDHQTLFYGSDQDVACLVGYGLVSTFLDKTVAQEPGCTEDIYSFTHLTVQEFFAAVYCAMTDHPLPDALQHKTSPGEETCKGHLDLFYRFLSGVLSERNANLLSRHIGLRCSREKVETYQKRIIGELRDQCGSGAQILNNLHCLFEQQDPSLAQAFELEGLRVNVSDEALSSMDYNAIKYFLNLTEGNISELDLTGTNINCEALKDLQPHLLRCERLWLGENNLDMNTVHVLADVLQLSECMTHLGIGWTDVSDEEMLVLSSAMRMSHMLQELCAIWNDLNDEDVEALTVSEGGSFVLRFTDDVVWEEWGRWVLARCEVSSNEKLVTVLCKVCNISIHCLEILWAKGFYKRLRQLIKNRIAQCTEDDMRRKLEKFENVLSS
ncbi:NLR family CARD domain-containing protein 3-like isoform X2 [Lampris incognitus]|uniref:NLR family CARD domain-containing protein 3-like isoform X2 n=1 Tax=Lampris incognitus TaxID=2546036 RepID=UPI0024B5E42E|nr:NLR family CARD domain-containing protein 3-like isoform X2 [Lampris incognitus]